MGGDMGRTPPDELVVRLRLLPRGTLPTAEVWAKSLDALAIPAYPKNGHSGAAGDWAREAVLREVTVATQQRLDRR